MDTIKIKSIYSSLEGLFFEIKEAEAGYSVDSTTGEFYNKFIETLISLTENDEYSLYKLMGNDFFTSPTFGTMVKLVNYKSKISALVNRLHGEYFENLTSPFSSVPDLQVNNSQVTSVQISIVEFSNYLSDKLHTSTDTKEKDFLIKLREKVMGVKNIAEIISLTILTAQQCGIDIEKIHKLFS